MTSGLADATSLSTLDLSSPVLRVLMTSDGTLTDMLHSLTGEDILIRKLRQQGCQTPARIDALDVPAGEWLVDRRVLLRGARTGRTYVYATSVIALNRLESGVRAELLGTDTPIGRLWRTHRIETFKDFVEYRQAPAGEMARYFDVDASTPVPSRTYRLIARGLAVMLITEHFAPELASL